MKKIRSSKGLVGMWMLIWLLWTPVSASRPIDSLQSHLQQHFSSYDLTDFDVFIDLAKVNTPVSEFQVRNFLNSGLLVNSNIHLEVFSRWVTETLRIQPSLDWSLLLSVFLYPFHTFF